MLFKAGRKTNCKNQSGKSVSFWSEMMGSYKYVYFGFIGICGVFLVIVLVVAGLVYHENVEQKKALDTFAVRLFDVKPLKCAEKLSEYKDVRSDGRSGGFTVLAAAALLRAKATEEEIRKHYASVYYKTPECADESPVSYVSVYFGDIKRFNFGDEWGPPGFPPEQRRIFNFKGKKEKGYIYFIIYSDCANDRGVNLAF